MTAQPAASAAPADRPSPDTSPWQRYGQQLEELDQRQAFRDLRQLLRALPSPAPTAWQGPLAYWRGKCALAESNPQLAILELTRCVQLQPERAHAHYLLGMALSHNRQWLDAAASLERALQLQPALIPAAEQQARALQALGRLDQALPILEQAACASGEASSSTEFQSLLWQLRVQNSCLAAAPASITQALSAPLRLSNSVLLDWLHTAAGLLLAGEWQLAQHWSAALATATPCLEASSQPLPRRLALMLQLVLQLLQSDPEASLTVNHLRSCLWWPASALEQEQWSNLSQPVLAMLWAKPEALRSCPQAEALLPELVALIAPAGVELQRPTTELERLTAHLPALLEAWNNWLIRDDIDWIANRSQLDQALLHLGDHCLDSPKRLVRHPGPQAQAMAMALQQRLLEVYLAAEQRWCNLQQPAPAKPGENRRWLLLASGDFPQCHLYRVEAKQEQLQALGCTCRIVHQSALADWAWSEHLLWADALIVCRLPASHAVLRAMAAAQAAGLPVYYDIDDLVFDAEHCPPTLESYGGTVLPHTHRRFTLDVALVAAAMRAADGVIVSTPTLAECWRERHPGQPVWVLPNLTPPALLALRQPPLPPHATTPLHLVVASGTTVHKLAWQQELAPALAVLMQRHPQLRLDLLGHLQVPLCLQPVADRTTCRPYSAYPRYLQSMRRGAIGLVVLEEGLFTDAKSAIRWMEFSVLGLASVLSPTRTYSELLQNGQHALFARGTHAWLEQIEALILNPTLRQRLAEQAQQHALAIFSSKQASTVWEGLIAPAQALKRPKRKLLVIHDRFAAPSSERINWVVQAQIKSLRQQQEITVLCAASEGWQENGAPSVEVGAWNGIRVIRLALSQPEAIPAFWQNWLIQEGFELVYAHGLAGLSADPLHQAEILQIPYLLHLHDRWWLDQIDADEPHHRELLQRATFRLAASQPLANLHHQAHGVSVTLMANPWMPLPCKHKPGARATGQPLRACCIKQFGWQDSGLAVLYTALLEAQLGSPGLELTIVDPGHKGTEPYHLVWGSVPVTVMPAGPWEFIGEVLAQHDLFLAPELTESVDAMLTKQALSAGLWVICSDAGSAAEAVRPCRNGDVVAAGDPQALAEVLEQRCHTHPTPEPLIAFPSLEPDGAKQLQALVDQALEPATPYAP